MRDDPNDKPPHDDELEAAITRAAEWLRGGAPVDEAESTIRDVAKLAQRLQHASATTASDEVPNDVMEWIWHMDLHLTEHDLIHAGRALRAAWPTVRAYLTRDWPSGTNTSSDREGVRRG